MQAPKVTKKEYAIAEISADHFVSRILDDSTIDETLKMSIEDEEIFNDLKKVWREKLPTTASTLPPSVPADRRSSLPPGPTTIIILSAD